MDRIAASEAVGAGSIPAGRTFLYFCRFCYQTIVLRFDIALIFAFDIIDNHICPYTTK